ncbi:MAG TPA: metallophosphoesterase [Bdellovibrionota bacterium]|jgi:hypothetical protein|nr:metallophosphoesterase [Bdellovibrionota bacterium]
MRRVHVKALTLLGALGFWCGCSAPVKRVPASDATSFTVVLLPDTQYYSKQLPEAFQRQTQWIEDHASELNIKMVLGLGDVVDNGSLPAQWNNAMKALQVLHDGPVPFFLAIGNHDYKAATPKTRDATQFNAHLGPAYYKDQATYGESMDGGNENFFGTVHAGERDYLVLTLEFSPRDSVLKWASHVVESHPDQDVIVIMHSYLFTDNTRMSACARYSKALYGLSQDNDGEEIWDKFASKYPNIKLVLNGHIPQGGTGRRFDLGENGNLVNEILSDYQNEPNAGNGWLRLMTFYPDQNRIDVKTYSPYLDAHPAFKTSAWKKDPANQFSIEYSNPALAAFKSATIRGFVRSGKTSSLCAGIAGATVRFPGGTATTDAQGRFTAVVKDLPAEPALAYRAVTLTVEKKGWATREYRVTVRDGAENAEQVLLAPESGHP